MFNQKAAEQFIFKNARPFEKAAAEVLICGQSPEKALNELKKFQNADGGFGHALEADNWNPNSNPIATNDAITWLYRMNTLNADMGITEGIVRYLDSRNSFDETEKKWLCCIDSNTNYPHAIWWEKKGNGIYGFNPTVSLSAFMVCFGKRTFIFEEILKESVYYLGTADRIDGDELKCFLLAYELLKAKSINDVIDLDKMKRLISERIIKAICTDTKKYGVEYVTTPSDFFSGVYLEFASERVAPLIRAELDILKDIQKSDGGFDISWKWLTLYSEFEQARNWWRPRVTLEKLLFHRSFEFVPVIL